MRADAVSFDLRAALLRKGDVESARLDEFAFRVRARTWRRVGEALGLAPDCLVARIAHEADAVLLADLAVETGEPPAALAGLHARLTVQVRAELVAERGDPAPHRLA